MKEIEEINDALEILDPERATAAMEDVVAKLQDEIRALPKTAEYAIARRASAVLSFWHGVARGAAERAAVAECEVARLQAELAQLRARQDP